MFAGRRRQPFPSDFLTRVGLAWAVVSALLLVINWGAITGLRFPDPDDTMRLLQVRDLLGGQSWFDASQYRADALGGGVPMHWSRLVDLPVAIAVFLLTPLIGAASAEIAALVFVPLVTLGCVMLLAARITWRLIGEEETNFAALIVALSVPVIAQLAPMRIDHHGWQLVCIMIALNGLLARSPMLGGHVIGASLAILMAISVEGLPISVAFFAVLGLRWLRDRSERAWLLGAIQALAVVSAAVFLATRGLGDLVSHCDAISPIHLGIFVWGALALTALSALEPLPLVGRLTGFALVGVGAAALVGFGAPQCATGGGFSDLDPLVHDYWYINIMEGLPVWHQTSTVSLQYAITPLIGLYAAIKLAQQSTDWLRRFWFDYAVILGASILVALLVARAGGAACLIAAPPLAWQLNRWLRALRTKDSPIVRAGGLVAVACALMPSLPLLVPELILPAQAWETAKGGQSAKAPAVVHLKMSDCRIEDSADILNALPKGEVFMPLDIAPRLLLFSHHSVPATGHHRGNDTMRLVIATHLGSAEEARVALQERGSKYYALCPDLVEPNNYAWHSPDSFAADLIADRAPDWLEPISTAEGTTFKLWRIKQPQP
ncbi:MAG: hypothetical protein AAFP79_01445 [Pseudomonadota bacterium]